MLTSPHLNGVEVDETQEHAGLVCHRLVHQRENKLVVELRVGELVKSIQCLADNYTLQHRNTGTYNYNSEQRSDEMLELITRKLGSHRTSRRT
jgi:hypothetical protein